MLQQCGGFDQGPKAHEHGGSLELVCVVADGLAIRCIDGAGQYVHRPVGRIEHGLEQFFQRILWHHLQDLTVALLVDAVEDLRFGILDMAGQVGSHQIGESGDERCAGVGRLDGFVGIQQAATGQCGLKIRHLQRFAGELVHPHVQRAFARVIDHIGGDQDDLGLSGSAGQLAYPFGGGETVEHRHVEVQQQHIEGRSLQQLYRFFAVFAKNGFMPHFLKQYAHVFEVDRVILGHQNLQRTCFVHLLAGGRVPVRRLGRRELQFGNERRSDAGLALCPYVAAHHPGQIARDLQSQTGATDAPAKGVVGLVEPGEKLTQRGLVHANTGIAHLEFDGVGTRGCFGEFDLDAAFQRELDGVVDQVEHDLSHPRCVGHDPDREVVGGMHVQAQSLVPGCDLHQAVDLLHQTGQVNRSRGEFEGA